MRRPSSPIRPGSGSPAPGRAWRRSWPAGERVYGITTGFGALKDHLITPDHSRDLQRNMIMSHSVGVGDPLPEEVVRAMLLVRANALAKGCSGIRLSVVQALLDLLNRRRLSGDPLQRLRWLQWRPGAACPI